ncbi:hypothetical protein GF324_14570 [bacterium]|nr:hypothetical protein [bacterium]
MRKPVLYVLLFTFIGLFLAQEAAAIPAFARKYRLSCTTCHAPFPRLKPYGDDFAGNGFVLEDEEAPRYFVDTGDEELDLIRDFPLAVRFDGRIRYLPEAQSEFDLQLPYLIKLLSGGALTDNLSYYFYMYMDERGEVVGVEDAYLMFNNAFGQDLDFYFGQFQVSDPLFKRELRLTMEDYMVYKYAPGESDIALAYDRGMMITLGLPTGTDVIAEVVNGNGLADAVNHVFDRDNYVSVAGRLSQGIGDMFRIGGFTYYGKEDAPLDDDGVPTSPESNEVLYWGPDVTINYQDYVELNVQYMHRTDSNPYFVAGYNEDDITSDGIMAELIILPNKDLSRHYAVLLYNSVKTDYKPYREFDQSNSIYTDDPYYETAALHLGHVYRRNIRFFVEYLYNFDLEDHYGGAGFSFAF